MTTLDKILDEGYKYIEDYGFDYKIYGKGDLRLIYDSKLDLIVIKYPNHLLNKADDREDTDKSYYLKKNLDCDGL